MEAEEKSIREGKLERMVIREGKLERMVIREGEKKRSRIGHLSLLCLLFLL